MVPSLGAGEEPKGDAFAVFPAEARREPAPEVPKPTFVDAAVAGDATRSIVALAERRAVNLDAGETTMRAAAGRVTVRPKPEKRKNFKERAKDRTKGKADVADMPAVPAQAAASAIAYPKPEKRKNFKERAKAKFAKEKTMGGTTPDTTAKAKSTVETKAKRRKSKVRRLLEHR